MSGNGNKPRIAAASAVLFALLASIIIRSYSLAAGDGRQLYDDPAVSISTVRGTIYDRDGKILAMQAPDYGFTISPAGDAAMEAAFISRYTRESAISIEAKIDSGVPFIPITMIPSSDAADEIRKEIGGSRLDGMISLARREARKKMTDAAFIGDVDSSLNGISGIERLCQESLDAVPSLFRDVAYGRDVYLTVDIEAQERLDSLGIPGSAAVIEDGAIIAWSGPMSSTILSSLVREVKSRDGVSFYKGSPLRLALDTIEGESGLAYYASRSGYAESIAEAFGDTVIS